MSSNNPCIVCPKTGSNSECKETCSVYFAYTLLYPQEQKKEIKSKYQKEAETESKLGFFRGYIFYPSGDVRSKVGRKLIKPHYVNGIPYISLCENSITQNYRLDQAMFRAFHCTYVINSRDIIHIDGKQKNCGIKNLRTDD